MLITPHSTKGGEKISTTSYFSEEFGAAETFNDLLKVALKISAGGGLKPQSNQVHLLHTLMTVTDSWLPLGNVCELYTEPSACMGMLTLSFLFR